LLALALTMSGMAHATQVIFRQLEDVISEANVIAVGTVRQREEVPNTSRCPSRPNAVDIHYTIEISQVLVGKLQAKSLTITLFPACGSPYYSEYTRESGIETGLQVGESYIFLLYSAQKGERTFFVRAEKTDRRDAVLKAWRDHEQKNKDNGK
jgi:hypothetical protein